MSDSQKLVIFTDGGARGNPGPAGIGVVVVANGQTIDSIGECVGEKTNNEAEYLAFLRSLEWLVQYRVDHLVVGIEWRLDSLLVVQQLNKRWKIKEPRLRVFSESAWKILLGLPCPYQVNHIPREKNGDADALVNQALDAKAS